MYLHMFMHAFIFCDLGDFDSHYTLLYEQAVKAENVLGKVNGVREKVCYFWCSLRNRGKMERL